jgi:hypothetical protein
MQRLARNQLRKGLVCKQKTLDLDSEGHREPGSNFSGRKMQARIKAGLVVREHIHDVSVFWVLNSP